MMAGRKVAGKRATKKPSADDIAADSTAAAAAAAAASVDEIGEEGKNQKNASRSRKNVRSNRETDNTSNKRRRMESESSIVDETTNPSNVAQGSDPHDTDLEDELRKDDNTAAAAAAMVAKQDMEMEHDDMNDEDDEIKNVSSKDVVDTIRADNDDDETEDRDYVYKKEIRTKKSEGAPYTRCFFDPDSEEFQLKKSSEQRSELTLQAKKILIGEYEILRELRRAKQTPVTLQQLADHYQIRPRSLLRIVRKRESIRDSSLEHLRPGRPVKFPELEAKIQEVIDNSGEEKGSTAKDCAYIKESLESMGILLSMPTIYRARRRMLARANMTSESPENQLGNSSTEPAAQRQLKKNNNQGHRRKGRQYENFDEHDDSEDDDGHAQKNTDHQV